MTIQLTFIKVSINLIRDVKTWPCTIVGKIMDFITQYRMREREREREHETDLYDPPSTFSAPCYSLGLAILQEANLIKTLHN